MDQLKENRRQNPYTYENEIDKEKWIESNRIEKKKDENHNYDFTFITYNKIKR